MRSRVLGFVMVSNGRPALFFGSVSLPESLSMVQQARLGWM